MATIVWPSWTYFGAVIVCGRHGTDSSFVVVCTTPVHGSSPFDDKFKYALVRCTLNVPVLQFAKPCPVALIWHGVHSAITTPPHTRYARSWELITALLLRPTRRPINAASRDGLFRRVVDRAAVMSWLHSFHCRQPACDLHRQIVNDAWFGELLRICIHCGVTAT